jgi:hypothetical protein
MLKLKLKVDENAIETVRNDPLNLYSPRVLWSGSEKYRATFMTMTCLKIEDTYRNESHTRVISPLSFEMLGLREDYEDSCKREW